MDNEKQKQEVIEFLENTYTGAKMVGDAPIFRFPIRISFVILRSICSSPSFISNIAA